MYRGHLTLDGIARMSANSDYRNLYQAMVQARRFDTGSCSESCEIWGDQLELEFEEVGYDNRNQLPCTALSAHGIKCRALSSP